MPIRTDVVLTKTEKGLEEIRSRAHKLPQRMRSVLIMIDGRTPVGAFTTRLTSYADLDVMLDALVEGGFVTVAASGAADVMAPVPAAEPAFSRGPATIPADLRDPGPSTLPLELAGGADQDVRDALRNLCRMLRDELGPDADEVTARLERATTRTEFISAVRAGQSLLVSAAPGVRQGGAQKAQKFQARAQVILDTWFHAR